MSADSQSAQQVLVFCRQIRQRLPLKYIRWPDKTALKDYALQGAIFDQILRPLTDMKPEGFRSVTRWDREWRAELAIRIEQAAVEAEEPDIDDGLMMECARYQRLPTMSGAEEAQMSVQVVYSAVREDSTSGMRISLWENPQVLSGSGFTGHRTWEAALALATEIFDVWLPQGRLRGKKVLELGAGTGILSFVCAADQQHGARRIVATDGDQGAVDRLLVTLKDNVGFSPACNNLSCGVYRWGEPLECGFIGDELRDGSFDLVIGADVTYDPSTVSDLVQTLTMVFKRNSKADCIISAPMRNADTLDRFLAECKMHSLQCTVKDSVSCSIGEQNKFFHSGSEAIRFIEICPQ